MNTCLNALVLKISRFDYRYIRMALTVLTLFSSGVVILSLPIHGDVGG